MANRWKVMSEYCREQHPLLCEEASEEEPLSPRYYHKVRSTTYRGRARSNLKGAAAVLSRWPDHWTSFLTYWWIGIGMISLTTFIIYNSLFAFSIIPTVNMKLANPVIVNYNEKTTARSSLLPEVYMHVFVGQKEDIDLNQYMPYVEVISNTFADFKFNFIVVVNDTNVGWISAEENNELALNMLWTKDKNIFEKDTLNVNINIEYITLSAYMNKSPLKKYWKTLPCQLIEFMARTVSIWDKGGVAFNPDILTSKFQHTLYIEKLQKLLNKYAHTNKVINFSKFTNKLNKSPIKHRKLNNIRDIIDALESEDISGNAFSQQTLSEAENKDIQYIRHERQVSTLAGTTAKNVTTVKAEALGKINPKVNAYRIGSMKQPDHRANSTQPVNSPEVNHNSTKMSLLPLFLEFLFHNKADIRPKPTEETVANRTLRRATLPFNPNEDGSLSVSNNVVKQTEEETKYIYEPVIISGIGIHNKSAFDDISASHNKESDENLEANRLTIDLKGNIIATKTACHAFLGTIFSNVIHHSEEETITDFIIAELTIFCKGLLSSCMGIDLILL